MDKNDNYFIPNTFTPTPIVIPVITPSSTLTLSSTQTSTKSPTASLTPTPTSTSSRTTTTTSTLSPTATVTSTLTKTSTETLTRSLTSTTTLTRTSTETPTVTTTLSSTPTPTLSSSVTNTTTLTKTSTETLTRSLTSTTTLTRTSTETPTVGVTPTATTTLSSTPTPTLSSSVTATSTSTKTSTETLTRSLTSTTTLTATATTTLTSTATKTATITLTPTTTTTLTFTPLSVQCLDSSNTVQMSNPYTFNNIAYADNDLIGMGTGTYTFTGITSAHPIGFVTNSQYFTVVAGTEHGSKTVEGISVMHYTGTVTVDITGDFGTVSYHCYNHGYMGGQNRLVFNISNIVDSNGDRITTSSGDFISFNPCSVPFSTPTQTISQSVTTTKTKTTTSTPTKTLTSTTTSTESASVTPTVTTTTTLTNTTTKTSTPTYTLTIFESSLDSDIDFTVVNKTGDSQYDDSEYVNIIQSAMDKWDRIILGVPKYPSWGMRADISFENLSPGVLGSAGITGYYGTLNYGDFFPGAGTISLSSSYLSTMKNNINNNFNLSELYYVVLHEVGHLLGITSLTLSENSTINGEPVTSYIDPVDGLTKYYYTGPNAFQAYKDYFQPYYDVSQFVGIPVEDDGGAGTANAHPEEGVSYASFNDREINGVFHPGIEHELMAGWSEGGAPSPLSKITIGFLEDMGYSVDYTQADQYDPMDPFFGDTPTVTVTLPTPTVTATETNSLTPTATLTRTTTTTLTPTVTTTLTATVTATLTPTITLSPQLWSPSEILTEAWYDFSDSTTLTESSNIVSQVDDKSGNGLHITVPPDDDGPTANSKTINGLDVIHFNGNELHNVLSSSIDHSPLDPLYLTLMFRPEEVKYQFFFALSETTATPRLYLRSTTDGSYQFNDNSGTLTGMPQVTTVGTTLLWTFKMAENSSAVYYNGSTIDNSVTVNRDPINHLHIGTNEQNGSHANASYAEFLMYRGDDDDRQKVEGYIAHKFGIADNLDENHTYKNSPPLA